MILLQYQMCYWLRQTTTLQSHSAKHSEIMAIYFFLNAFIKIITVDKIEFVINCYCCDRKIVGNSILVL